MPKDTKTLGNNKARACESLALCIKKGCASVLTQPRFLFFTLSILLINVKSLFAHLTSFLFDVLIIKVQK
mgnify:CR=1 FL=1